MPSGCKLIFLTFLSRQLNHSPANNVGIHVTRVGGNKSSWNSSLWIKIIFKLFSINIFELRSLMISLNFYLNAWNCKTERLNCIICQTERFGKFNGRHITMILCQKTQPLMWCCASMMWQWANVWSFVCYFKCINCRITLKK